MLYLLGATVNWHGAILRLGAFAVTDFGTIAREAFLLKKCQNGGIFN